MHQEQARPLKLLALIRHIGKKDFMVLERYKMMTTLLSIGTMLY